MDQDEITVNPFASTGLRADFDDASNYALKDEAELTERANLPLNGA